MEEDMTMCKGSEFQSLTAGTARVFLQTREKA